ncbi:MAG: hypothetical protein DLM58_10830 [Pseudonocardiales bacterium]|nr:MAG: hypothetical protein DLM58_10830 [Pseudonocardiales bacterium]
MDWDRDDELISARRQRRAGAQVAAVGLGVERDPDELAWLQIDAQAGARDVADGGVGDIAAVKELTVQRLVGVEREYSIGRRVGELDESGHQLTVTTWESGAARSPAALICIVDRGAGGGAAGARASGNGNGNAPTVSSTASPKRSCSSRATSSASPCNSTCTTSRLGP